MSLEVLHALLLGLLLLGLCAAMAGGIPVAFALGGSALMVALLGMGLGAFDAAFLAALPGRLFDTLTSATLLAVPLFVFMGVMLERSRLAEDLLTRVAGLFGPRRGGLAVAVVLVGGLLAASTGIVGATVVTMGLIALPVMLRAGYDPRLATGAIAASGTLGQIIPPSIVLVLLGDQLGSAYQRAQLAAGNFAPETLSVGDLFAGALLPGLGLVLLYLGWVLWVAWRRPAQAPALPASQRPGLLPLLRDVLPAVGLVLLVLGSILAGIATPTEAAAVGAVGACVFAALRGQFSLSRLLDVAQETVKVSAMVFAILFGAALFSLVFRGLGGDELVHAALSGLPGGRGTAVFAVMLLMFLLGFVLDFIEITFIVVPIVAPVLFALGVDPVWLGVMMAINLQTSFLTPPFGFALFYLRGVAPPDLPMLAMYRGVLPFIALQLGMLGLLALWPGLATWLPDLLYR